MGPIHRSGSIQVGLLADEPIRMEGLTSIFEALPTDGSAHLVPVIGEIEELLSSASLEYMVLDLHSSSGGVKTLELVRRKRPDIRLIVIGPEGNDELVLDSIVSGARAYLDLKASPQTVRQAIEVVTSGSIWAPRKLLSKLVDRLLNVSDTSVTSPPAHLTDRERQVLELILMARSNREIAHKLGIEERTVKSHVGRLMRKTGSDNRVDLCMRALDLSLLTEQGAIERRHGDRRESDRRPGAGSEAKDSIRRVVTHE